MKDAFIHGVWATTIAFVIMYFLGSSSNFQMDGIIIGINAEAILLTMMHYMTVCKKIGVSIFMSPLKQMKSSWIEYCIDKLVNVVFCLVIKIQLY